MVLVVNSNIIDVFYINWFGFVIQKLFMYNPFLAFLLDKMAIFILEFSVFVVRTKRIEAIKVGTLPMVLFFDDGRLICLHLYMVRVNKIGYLKI